MSKEASAAARAAAFVVQRDRNMHPLYSDEELSALRNELHKRFAKVAEEAVCYLIAEDFEKRVKMRDSNPVTLEARIRACQLKEDSLPAWLVYQAFMYCQSQGTGEEESDFYHFMSAEDRVCFSGLVRHYLKATDKTSESPKNHPESGAVSAPVKTSLPLSNEPSLSKLGLAFIVIAALLGASVIGYFFRQGLAKPWAEPTSRDKQAEKGTPPGPTEPPKLIRLTFKVRPKEDEPTIPWDVLNPATRIDRTIRPGNEHTKDKDCLQLEGAFDRPAQWHVLWHDSNGKWFRPLSSTGAQAGVLYPVPEPGREVAYVDDGDPPGVHALFLISGAVTAGQVDALITRAPLSNPLLSQGPPAALGRSTGAVRGPGTGSGTAMPASDQYLTAVGKWLPAEVTTAKFITLLVGKR